MIANLVKKYRQYGPRAVLDLILVNIVCILSVIADRLFDLRYGTDTSKPIHRPQLLIESENVRYGTSYFPTPWWTFRRIIRAVGIDPSRYIYIDFGSGKGRLPLMAASLKGGAFRKSIGVEYASDLHETAVCNARQFRSCTVEFVCQDASTFPIPHHPCVLYFFNPFDAPVLRCVLDNIAARPVFPDIVVYFDRTGYIGAFERLGFYVTREIDVRDQGGKRRRVAILKRECLPSQ